MAHIELATALFAATFFYLSTREIINDTYRRLFMFSGFLMIFITFGLAMTSSAEYMLAASLLASALIFMLLMGVEVLAFVGEVLSSLINR